MATTTAPARDERVAETPLARRLMARPELGAVAGTILVFLFFAVAARGTGMFSALGIVTFLEVVGAAGHPGGGGGAVDDRRRVRPVGGLDDRGGRRGPGHPGGDLGLALVAVHPPGVRVAAGVGWINGTVVVRTGLPSFIVTLAGLFILRGLTIGFTRLITGRTQVSGLQPLAEQDWLAPLFAGKVGYPVFAWLAAQGWITARTDGTPQVPGIPMSILWWIGLACLATWVLLRTRVGNWIFAAGGDANAARNVGVPVAAVKIGLFMCAAMAAALFACVQTLGAGSADVLRGTQKEFEAIIAAVIGGCLLTGGYGSAIGAAFGALLFGTVQQGIFYTGVNTDWFKVFLGGMLLIAVLFNSYIRKKVTGGR